MTQKLSNRSSFFDTLHPKKNTPAFTIIEVSDERSEKKSKVSEVGLYASGVNFRISNTDLDKLIKTSFKFPKFSRSLQRMSKTEFEIQVNKLYKCCLKSTQDVHELHLRREAALKILHDIICRIDPANISVSHVIHMVWCIMSCTHHFQIRLLDDTMGCVYYNRKKAAKRCMKLYSKFIRLFPQNMHRILLNSIIIFFKEGKLWDIEYVCTDLVTELISIYEDIDEAIRDILYTAERESLKDINTSKQLIQVLYETLERFEWKKVSKSLMIKLVDVIDKSLSPSPTDEYNYGPLARGLELSLKRMMANMQTSDLLKLLTIIMQRMLVQTDPDAIRGLGHLALHLSETCAIKGLRDLNDKVVENMNALILSDDPLKMVLTAKCWQTLLDRHGNCEKIAAPRIYFENCDYHLTWTKGTREDYTFFKALQHRMYNTGLHSYLKSPDRKTFQVLFRCFAIDILEHPYKSSASTKLMIAMGLQEQAFEVSDTNLVRSNHLHAIVMAMMSLICYIFNAEVLYQYVNKVMERRAQWAPHLNPPLKETYEYAQHHILWNKPDLFFEDWEARYGLWKCFMTKKLRKKPKQKKNKEGLDDSVK